MDLENITDLLFLIFILLFWIFGSILKTRKKIPLPQEQPEVFKPYKIKIETLEPVIEKEGVSLEEAPELIETAKEKLIQTPTEEIVPGTNLGDLLKSESSLKKAVILSEILGKPVSER